MDNPGLFGESAAYYGTVEQQGRMTLHLHMVLWIMNALSPQVVRERLMSGDSVFQKRMVEYLETAHQREFCGDSHIGVRDRVAEVSSLPDYLDPTCTMPESAPPPCNIGNCQDCECCHGLTGWWVQFKDVVNDLLLKSNMHPCIGSK